MACIYFYIGDAAVMELAVDFEGEIEDAEFGVAVSLEGAFEVEDTAPITGNQFREGLII
jgi:hypothetical protein